MNCNQARDHLTAGGKETATGITRHLGDCARCRRFAEAMEAVRREIRDHHTALEGLRTLAVKTYLATGAFEGSMDLFLHDCRKLE